MKGKAPLVMLVLLLLATTSTAAWAKDSLSVNVTIPDGQPDAVIVNNGQAVGTIQLFYTVSALQFTTGTFAQFDVNWSIAQGKPATEYGSGVNFNLIQDQQGGNVDLAPEPSSFLLTSATNFGKSTVTVSITNDKGGNPPPSADGTDLVGNLKLDATNKVGSVTNIQVHIRLVDPSACLKVYDFVTDQDFNLGILSTTNLNVPKNGQNAGKVTSSQPGQFSDNVLIANTCPTSQSFDLRILLDPSFETNPQGNPGQAVFTYSTSGDVDPATFNIASFGAGTPQGQDLCLENVTVPANTTFLATVHSQVIKGILASSLDSDGNGKFDFKATLYQNVNSQCTGDLDTFASPNPATFALPFTINN